MRILSPVICLVLLFSSCSKDKTNFTVEVQVEGTNGETLYLAERNLSGTAVVDSAVPDKSGEYVLEGYTKQPDFYVIYFHPGHFINLIIHPGDDFRVLSDAATFDADYLVEGSMDSRLIQKLVSMQTRTLEKITEISERYENSKGRRDFESIKKEIDSAYEQTVAEHKQFSINLIRENPGSLATLMTLYQQLGRNAPVFDYKRDFNYYAMVDSNLAGIYPNSEAVIDLNLKVTELRNLLKLETGSPVPEIALPDSTGNIIPLNTLRGRQVLLIFWASWSSQSVALLKQFHSLYPKAGNMVYYQVSLDRTRSSWLRNISGNNSGGFHVSDLLYWDSPVVSQFHIEKLPVTYLIDEEGFILHKDITAGELEQMMSDD